DPQIPLFIGFYECANNFFFKGRNWADVASILVGNTIDYLKTKERVEQAIAKNANDFSLFQLRGFAYEMINLSWLERKLCNIFFAKVPECTVDEAIAGFSEIYFAPFAWAYCIIYCTFLGAVHIKKLLAIKFLNDVKNIKEKDDGILEDIQQIQNLVAKCG
ncbi:unnamed protein product, partial [Dracunculus medinensis]|uniref:Bestrophin homolog n=1 Tax=Dracunculus medinensis TaxID=318479 RepID=A0A158Q6D3_DRAME